MNAQGKKFELRNGQIGEMSNPNTTPIDKDIQMNTSITSKQIDY